ncbi:MAG: restriction endonuclease subunit S [Rickettsiales bacterium]|jgi:type I restriction enzyme S subunit|nr:restriction endonuclease subunit S [Rickettsiales bacterium]
MSKTFLGNVARERKEQCKSGKDAFHSVGLEHLIPQDINLTMWNERTENNFTKMFHMGDILFGRRNAYLKKAVIAPFDGICSPDITVMEAIKDEIDSELLPFVIQNNDFFDYAIMHSAGSMSPRVKWDDLKKYEFTLPPLSKQKKLASLLWSIETTIRTYKSLLLKMDELVKSEFIKLFKNTIRKELSELAIITMGQSPSSISYNTKKTGIPFFQGKTEFGEKYVSIKWYCSSPKRIANAGDILMSVRAPVGCVNITPEYCCIGRGLASIRGKKDRMHNDYLFYALRIIENDIASIGQGATFKAINKEQLYKILIPDVPLSLQQQFADFTQQTDSSKQQIQQSIDNLNIMSKALIHKYLVCGDKNV